MDIVWPTRHRRYTQRWMARPSYYSQFKGLIGHEGVDIECANGEEVFAIAAGVVVQVGEKRPGHAYGEAVRIQHHWNGSYYISIYAHCQAQSIKVKLGDAVTAGQLIALGDSTGNVSGVHLHFGFMRVGASAAHETPQAYDLIDPHSILDTARMVWEPIAG